MRARSGSPIWGTTSRICAAKDSAAGVGHAIESWLVQLLNTSLKNRLNSVSSNGVSRQAFEIFGGVRCHLRIGLRRKFPVIKENNGDFRKIRRI
jgi:hypothetical protein